MRLSKIIWAAKQLLPLTYWTTYRHGGVKYACIWRMWFGRSFDVTRFAIPDSGGV